eukprot:11342098-Alexandrium_andersonii.AAC.1
MSASLVGSEMCIRDSKPHLQRPNGRPRLRAAPTSGFGRDANSSRASIRCLLYTSDAADDM